MKVEWMEFDKYFDRDMAELHVNRLKKDRNVLNVRVVEIKAYRVDIEMKAIQEMENNNK